MACLQPDRLLKPPCADGLGHADPCPLRREAFAMSRARLNMRRIQMALVGIRRFKRRFDEIKVGAMRMGWLFSGPGTAATGCKLPA